MTSHGPPRTSSVFKEEQDSIAILTRDNALIFYPRSLLPFCSPIFRDMLTVANVPNPFQMAATLQDLEILFTFFHPGMEDPVVQSAAQWEALFRIADQFVMVSLQESLRRVLTMSFVIDGQISEPLYKKEPLPVLILANQANFAVEKELALQEVVKSYFTDTMVASGNYRLPVSLMAVIYERRNKRIHSIQRGVLELTRLLINNGDENDLDAIMNWTNNALKRIKDQPTVAILEKSVHKNVLISNLISNDKDEYLEIIERAREEETD